MPRIARKAKAWNSDWAPLPMIAMVAAFLGARCFAATADIAAVRSAVRMVISESRTGYPVATSESKPKAVTVWRPAFMFLGWPLTYLKP